MKSDFKKLTVSDKVSKQQNIRNENGTKTVQPTVKQQVFNNSANNLSKISQEIRMKFENFVTPSTRTNIAQNAKNTNVEGIHQNEYKNT